MHPLAAAVRSHAAASGQHLLSAMFQERYGRPTVSFHLGSGTLTIDLRGQNLPGKFWKARSEPRTELFIEDRPVTVRYGTAEDLAETGRSQGSRAQGNFASHRDRGRGLAALRRNARQEHRTDRDAAGAALYKNAAGLASGICVRRTRAERAGAAGLSGASRGGGEIELRARRILRLPLSGRRGARRNFKRTRALLERLAEIEAKQAVSETAEGPGGLRDNSARFRRHRTRIPRLFRDGRSENGEIGRAGGQDWGAGTSSSRRIPRRGRTCARR